jgi:hypothetical protein
VNIGSVDTQDFTLRFLISCVFLIAHWINRDTFFPHFVFYLILKIRVVHIRVLMWTIFVSISKMAIRFPRVKVSSSNNPLYYSSFDV